MYTAFIKQNCHFFLFMPSLSPLQDTGVTVRNRNDFSQAAAISYPAVDWQVRSFEFCWGTASANISQIY